MKALNNAKHEIGLDVRVRNVLLDTWLPVAAIASMLKIPTKTALAILQRNQIKWGLICVRVRIDGHNPVHLFRKRAQDRIQVMGVWMPVKQEVESELENG